MRDAGKWSRPGLAVLVLTLPIYDALPQLYILSKSDGCGAQADQAVRLLWLADELGYSLDEVARMNLRKLADRRARNVIHGSGDDR